MIFLLQKLSGSSLSILHLTSRGKIIMNSIGVTLEHFPSGSATGLANGRDGSVIFLESNKPNKSAEATTASAAAPQL
jgi:hypothetical protein